MKKKVHHCFRSFNDIRFIFITNSAKISIWKHFCNLFSPFDTFCTIWCTQQKLNHLITRKKKGQIERILLFSSVSYVLLNIFYHPIGENENSLPWLTHSAPWLTLQAYTKRLNKYYNRWLTCSFASIFSFPFSFICNIWKFNRECFLWFHFSRRCFFTAYIIILKTGISFLYF